RTFWTALRASTVRRKRLPVATRSWTAAPLRPLAIHQEGMTSHPLLGRGLRLHTTPWGLCPSWRPEVAGLVHIFRRSGSRPQTRPRIGHLRAPHRVGTLPELNAGDFARALTTT